MQNPYILSNYYTIYSWGQKVQKGHWRSNHGHERSYCLEQKRKVVTYDILGCSAFFWYTSCICSKMLSFEVIRGQWRSAWGHSFDLSLVWTYYHCNSAVFSFHLICNMPIFSWLSIFQFLRSSEVNEGQPEVTHLTSHLSGHIFTVILLFLALIWYATPLYS